MLKENIKTYDYLQAFCKTLVKRYIKGQTIEQLKYRIKKYNNEFLKDKKVILSYDDLTIKQITDDRYYLKLSNTEMYYIKSTNKLIFV